MLDLGCRFSRSNPIAVRAAGKYCDVISFNRYQYTVADLRLPEGVDKPVLIGEFQFGAVDRGMFNASLSPTADQADRAQAYKDYVESALDNPFIVGAHWFQYADQACTGRGDEEKLSDRIRGHLRYALSGNHPRFPRDRQPALYSARFQMIPTVTGGGIRVILTCSRYTNAETRHKRGRRCGFH